MPRLIVVAASALHDTGKATLPSDPPSASNTSVTEARSKTSPSSAPFAGAPLSPEPHAAETNPAPANISVKIGVRPEDVVPRLIVYSFIWIIVDFVGELDPLNRVAE